MSQYVKKVIIIWGIIIVQFLIYFNIKITNADAEIVGTWDVSYDSDSNVTATLYKDGNLVISGTGKMTSVKSNSDNQDRYIVPDQYIKDVKSIKIESGVTSIGCNAFRLYRAVENVIISDTVTEIGGGAFTGCTSLKSLHIPANVQSIGNDLLYTCINLTSISIDANNTNYMMEDGILYNKEKTRIIKCSKDKQKEIYNIPTTVEKIDEFAFYNCDKIRRIVLPEKITKIGTYLFYKCTSLEDINIPNNVKLIETTAFGLCYSLKNINIPINVEEIGRTAFYYCTSLEKIHIPANVKKIGDSIFYNCIKLESISIDANNTNYMMEDGILYNKEKTRIIKCSKDKQKEIYNIPTTVEQIDEFAFYNCDTIRKVVLPEKLTRLCYCLFEGCISLEDINIPNNVTEIHDYAFKNCFSLKKIDIPESVIYIKSEAFCECDSIKSINISKNIQEIGLNAFSYCNNLESISVDDRNTNYILENGILYDKDKTRIIICSRDKQEESYEIPATVLTIDKCAFSYCDNIKSIVLSENVKEIGYCAFGYCKNLTSLSISPSNENFINEDGILYDKDKTRAIICIRDQQKESYEIPSTVKKIDQSAFLGCDRIKNIKLPDEITYIGPAMFWYCSSLQTINLPVNLSRVYINQFDEYNNTIYITPFRGCKSLKEINVSDENKIYSTENGILYNKDKKELLVYPQGKKEDVFIIPSNVEKISDFAFSESNNLKKLIILENIKNIGKEILNENEVTKIYCKENTEIEKLARENELRYEVDKEAPDIIKIEGNLEKRVEDKVILGIIAEDNKSGLATKAYSFDGGETWQESNKKEYTKNTNNIIIKVRDNIGNVAEYNSEINITNIKRIKKVSIKQMPEKTEYKKGEIINLKGLELEVEYDDGTKEVVTEGYATNVSTLNEIGDKEVKVSYEGQEVSFKVTVVENDDGGKQDDGKQDDGKQDDGKKDDGKQDDGKQDDGKQEDGKQDGGKQDDGKQDDGKQDDGKQDDGKQEDGKQDGGKQDDGKKDDGKKDGDNSKTNQNQNTEKNIDEQQTKKEDTTDTANNNKVAKNTITNLSNNKLPYTGAMEILIPIGIIVTLSIAIVTSIGYIKYKKLK